MKVNVNLNWTHASKNHPFKSLEAKALFEEYKKRTSTFIPVESRIIGPQRSKGAGVLQHWLCDSGGKALSSEELAQSIQKMMNQGCREWSVCVGGPNGWTQKDLENASFVWSLGTMTLPHELAAVVIMEQIYRAYTIIKGHPYHSSH